MLWKNSKRLLCTTALTVVAAQAFAENTTLITGESFINDVDLTASLSYAANPTAAIVNPAASVDNTNPGSASSSAVSTQATTNSGNVITNDGSVTLGLTGGTIAIEFDASGNDTADAEAYVTISGVAGPYSGSTTAVASSDADATTSGNDANNSGTLTADIGIQLSAEAISTATATAQTSVSANTDNSVHPEETANATSSAVANAAATSEVDGNTISNAGAINARQLGVYLYSEATASAGYVSTATATAPSNSGASTSSQTGSDTSAAVATISGNTVENAGQINLQNNDAAGTLTPGVRLEAVASDVAPASYSGTAGSATATVTGNTISNGADATISAEVTVAADTYGILLTASAANVATVSANTISNEGLIDVSETQGAYHAAGIRLSANPGSSGASDAVSANNIANSGMITSSGFGIVLDGLTVSNNTVTNTGSIVALDGFGLDFYGVTLADNVFTTNGVVIADDSNGGVVRFEGAAGADVNTLQISAPAYFSGAFVLDRDANVDVELTSGVSHSTYWVFADNATSGVGADSFTTAGEVEWFTGAGNTTQNGTADTFATIDPSALAAAPHQSADLSTLAANLASRSLNGDEGAWLIGGNTQTELDGNLISTMDQSIDTNAVALGYNMDWDKGSVAFMIGHAQSDLIVGSQWTDHYVNSYDNSAEGEYLGISTDYNVGQAILGFGVFGGRMSHTDSRFVNDNTAAGGVSYATASYDSSWFAPELRVTTTIDAGNGFSISPSLTGRYTEQSIDAYSETGSNANATYDARTLKTTDVTFGMNFSKSFEDGILSASVARNNRTITGSDTADVALLNDDQAVTTFVSDVDSWSATLSYEFEMSDNAGLSFYGTYAEGDAMTSSGFGIDFQVAF